MTSRKRQVLVECVSVYTPLTSHNDHVFVPLTLLLCVQRLDGVSLQSCILYWCCLLLHVVFSYAGF